MLILILFALRAQIATPAAEPSGVVSVCEMVANDPTKLNGKVVAVRGMLVTTEEGDWLGSKGCDRHLVTKGLSWPSILEVQLDDSNSARQSWKRMKDQARQSVRDDQLDEVWVTIVGRIETRRSMDDEVVRMPYGMALAGFGHGSAAPAAITAQVVKDVKVERHVPQTPFPLGKQ